MYLTPPPRGTSVFQTRKFITRRYYNFLREVEDLTSEYYHYNGTNFSKSIYRRKSFLRRVISYINAFGEMTKFDYYQTFNPSVLEPFCRKDAGPFPNMYGRYDRPRPQFNGSLWCAVQNAGVIVQSDRRDHWGRVIYVPGPMFDRWKGVCTYIEKNNL